MIFFFLVAAVLYALPTIVALLRGRAIAPVFILNLFLGWTLIGWVAALVWSVTERTALETERRRASPAAGMRIAAIIAVLVALVMIAIALQGVILPALGIDPIGAQPSDPYADL